METRNYTFENKDTLISRTITYNLKDILVRHIYIGIDIRSRNTFYNKDHEN